MLQTFKSRLAVAASLTLAASTAMAAVIQIDTTNPANGLTDIYSSTFDGALIPCTGASPSYCSFFGGDVPAGRQIVVSPNPSGVINAVPGGITGATSGSSLNLTINGGNLELTGGTVAFAPVSLTIGGSTVVTPSGVPGFVLNSGLQTAALNANGQAEFLVNLSPSIAADFSTFSQIVLPADCSGSLCALIGILKLDMLRYRLFVDYDPTFTSFTADFIGQTDNNSVVFATLNSTVVPVPAAVWLLGSGLGLLVGFRRRIAA